MIYPIAQVEAFVYLGGFFTRLKTFWGFVGKNLIKNFNFNETNCPVGKLILY